VFLSRKKFTVHIVEPRCMPKGVELACFDLPEFSVGLLRVLEYSLTSISGYKFPFPVAVFLQSIDELLEFMQTRRFRDFIFNMPV